MISTALDEGASHPPGVQMDVAETTALNQKSSTTVGEEDSEQARQKAFNVYHMQSNLLLS